MTYSKYRILAMTVGIIRIRTYQDKARKYRDFCSMSFRGLRCAGSRIPSSYHFSMNRSYGMTSSGKIC
jgi:hypothetical protein